MFERKEVDRIILSRPAVEAGERLASCPATARKGRSRLRPIYDALYDLMDSRIVERALQMARSTSTAGFHVRPHADNAAITLDEAQNTTSMQMKMFLTRWRGSRMIVTGDLSHVDLPNGETWYWRRQAAGSTASRAWRR